MRQTTEEPTLTGVDIVKDLNIPKEHIKTFCRALYAITLMHLMVNLDTDKALKEQQPKNFTEFKNIVKGNIDLYNQLSNSINSTGKGQSYTEGEDWIDLTISRPEQSEEIPYMASEVTITIREGFNDEPVAKLADKVCFSICGIKGELEKYTIDDVTYTGSLYMK